MPQRTKGGLQPTRQPILRTHQHQKGKLIDYMWHLKKEGLSDATVKTKFKILKLMSKNNVNLDDPEAVKLFIARRETWSNGHKQIAIYAYDHYAKMINIQWAPPFYRYNPSIPFVPTEKEVDALISACSKKISTTLLALKETGFRIGELWNCKWTDLDEEKSTLKCKAENHKNTTQTEKQQQKNPSSKKTSWKNARAQFHIWEESEDLPIVEIYLN